MNEENINIVVSLDTSQVEAGVKKLNKLGSDISSSMSGVFSGATEEATIFGSDTVKAISSVVAETQKLVAKAQEAADVYRDVAEESKTLAAMKAGTDAGEAALKEAAKLDTLAKKYAKLSQAMQQRLADAQAELQVAMLANNSYEGLSSNLDRVTVATNDLATASRSVATSMESVREQASQVSDSINVVVDTSGKVVQSFGQFVAHSEDFSSQADKVAKAMEQVASKSDKAAKNVSKATDAVSLLKKGFKALVSYKVVKFLGDATAKAIAFSESIHTLKIAAGESAKELYKFVNIVSEKFGINKEEIISATTAFKQMGKNMGLATEQSNILARGFTLMAIDMQALYEIPLEDALSRLESVTTGYGRALKNNGMIASETYLQEVALSLGITERVASMSEANKLGLRYIAIMRQMANAQGEYAKTIESASNQMRVFKAQVSQTITAIGSLFYNFVSKILPYINGILMAFRALIGVLAQFFGFKLEKFEESTGGIADNVGSIGDAATDTAKKMKQLVAPFDELNILSEDAADAGDSFGGLGGGLDPRILEAMKEYDSLMDNVRMKAHDVRDYIMHTLGFTEKLNEETGELEWTWNFDDMVTGLQNAWNDITIWWSGLDPGAKLAAILIGAFVGYLAISGLASIIGTIVTIITTILNTIITFGTAIVSAVSLPVLAIVALIGLIVAAVIDLWNNNEEFRDKVTKMLDTLWTKLRKLVDDMKKAFKGLLEFFDKTFGPAIQTTVDFVKNLWGDFRDFIGSIILNLLSFFDGLIEFLDGIFTMDIDKALNGLYKMFLSVGTAIMNIFVVAMNAVVGAIEWGLNVAIDFVNKLIEALNQIPGVNFEYFSHVHLDAFKMQYDDVEDLLNSDSKYGSLKGYDSYNDDYRVYAPPSDYNEDYRVSSGGFVKPAPAEGPTEFSWGRSSDIADKIIVQIGGTQVDAEIYKSAQRGGMAAGLQTVGGGFTG